MPTMMDEIFPVLAESTQETNNATLTFVELVLGILVTRSKNEYRSVLDLNKRVANDAAQCVIDNSAGSSQTTAFKSNAGHHAGAPELRR